MLTVNKFLGDRAHITGNRCEKGIDRKISNGKAANLFEYKRKRIFNCEPPEEETAPRGVLEIREC